MSVRCFIGVGSNLGDPVVQMQKAWSAVAAMRETELEKTSSLYGTNPMGPQDQPDYINSVAQLKTDLSPLCLLDELQNIENASGRERGQTRWSARTLDLDILLYGQQVLSSERLTVPHPGMTVRSFVLVPLLEIAPDCNIPGLGRADTFAATAEQFGIHRLEETAQHGQRY